MVQREDVMRKLLLLFLVLIPVCVFSVYMQNLPSQVTQPDGTILNLLASGDEFYNKLHDANGYTIIQSQTDGYYYYAQKIGEELVPSAWRVGSTNPAVVNLTPNLNISEAAYKEKARQMRSRNTRNTHAPSTGTVNNICILIRFADQTEFEIPRTVYEENFNALDDSAISERNYFKKVSYNQLDVVTSIYPVITTENNLSYQDSHNRNYYMPYNAVTNPGGYVNDRIEREQALLTNAINAIASQIPDTLNIDADNDTYVDNVCFIVRGPHTAWADLLWGHYTGFFNYIYINGKRVDGYTFQMEDQNDVRTLCHEMFHSIGSPDLYHYDFNGVSPTGNWDIMDCGNGHMGAYMKWKYGHWINYVETISISGDYILRPSSENSIQSCYRINIPDRPYEFFILEYRKKGSDIFEQSLPDSGLLIYRIKYNLWGNSEGPPDEVYLYRPNGTSTVNGQICEAALSRNNYRTEFNDYTSPNCTLIDNTLAHLNISNIGYCGYYISFHYSSNNNDFPPVINIEYPQDGSTQSNGLVNILASAAAQDSISQVEFFLDGLLIGTDHEAPYEMTIQDSLMNFGYHELVATAQSSNGLSSSDHVNFRMIDPMQPAWFSWTSEYPDYNLYGRGFLPIQVAIDLDLGSDEYIIKKLAYNIIDDPYGNPAVQGMVSAKINRFANGAITDTTLVDLGDFYPPMTGYWEEDIFDNSIITGQIALIINLYEYQNIMFDVNGISGHSWYMGSSNHWIRTYGLILNGAADIGLKLQNPYVEMDDNITPVPGNSLTCYPNPFHQQTTFAYSLVNKSKDMKISIYNLKGQKVKSFYYSNQDKGKHTMQWDGTDSKSVSLSSGLYLVRISGSGMKPITRKITLLK